MEGVMTGKLSHANVKPKQKEGELRRFPEEADEDILRESNARFVLFPIRYREVRRAADLQLIFS